MASGKRGYKVSEFIPFRFSVSLHAADQHDGPILCAGQFSEVSGLELTMEPKTIQEGGRNWGEVQRCGPTKFSTLILKRGVTTVNDLWSWFDVTSRGANYGYRMAGVIEVKGNPPPDPDAMPGDPVEPVVVMTWRLTNVLPVKFKGPDLSATANQVAIEELHLVHEGLELTRPSAAAGSVG